ncbi:hypothetical protein JTB14_022705 [Gonioctena quinquepunctata]|nr:hypothetical protein JTB14_022705 [Gonioctena quinquepunctata]
MIIPTTSTVNRGIDEMEMETEARRIVGVESTSSDERKMQGIILTGQKSEQTKQSVEPNTNESMEELGYELGGDPED